MFAHVYGRQQKKKGTMTRIETDFANAPTSLGRLEQIATLGI
jgi:hypothetical protein